MESLPPILHLFVLCLGVLGVAGVVTGMRLQPAGHSRVIGLGAALPALGMLGLFYSLAIHMHRSLGEWPHSIGTNGFSTALSNHASVAVQYFGHLLLFSLFIFPVAFALCVGIPKWRGALFYLGVYALAWLLCFGIMMLAPSPFLYWWWD